MDRPRRNLHRVEVGPALRVHERHALAAHLREPFRKEKGRERLARSWRPVDAHLESRLLRRCFCKPNGCHRTLPFGLVSTCEIASRREPVKLDLVLSVNARSFGIGGRITT